MAEEECIFNGKAGGGESEDSDDDLAFLCGVGDGEFANIESDDEEEEIPMPTPKTIERVDITSLTPEVFEEKFAKTCTPVILTGAADVMPMGFLDLLLEAHGDRYLPLDFDKNTLVKLNDFCKFEDKQLLRSYVRNLHVSLWFPDLLKHVTFPSVFGYNYLVETDNSYPKEYHNWYELFINTNKCVGFPFLHRDTCHTHAFTMQLQGTKQFWMFPLSDSQYLYPSSESLNALKYWLTNSPAYRYWNRGTPQQHSIQEHSRRESRST